MRAQDALALVGNTPLVRLRKASEATGAVVLGKLESRNPSGSVKDRLVLGMVRAAQADGRLGAGGTIVVASAGNTAVSAAVIAAALDLRCLVVAPEAASGDWRRLVQGIGAEVVTTPTRDGMGGAMRRAQQEALGREGAVLLSPFTDAGAPAGFADMAEEIWRDTDGRIDRLVVGVGTAATAAGLSRVLSGKGRSVAIVAVEPQEAPNLSGGPARPHRIAGIGAGFVPAHWQEVGVSEVVPVSSSDAVGACRELATEEGLLLGPSSGAAVAAAQKTARAGEVVVVVLADSGERYLTLPGFVPGEDENGRAPYGA